MLELDEYADELQNVFDNISGVRLDPEQLQVSRQVEIDFTSRLNVYRERPRHWATHKSIPVIPTKWVDVNKGDAGQSEYRSRLGGEELKTVGPYNATDICVDGTVRVCYVLALQSADVETRVHIVRRTRPVRWRSSCLDERTRKAAHNREKTATSVHGHQQSRDARSVSCVGYR